MAGAAGLRGTLAAAKAGKVICLANKESLVLAGELLMQAAQAHGAGGAAQTTASGTEAFTTVLQPCAS